MTRRQTPLQVYLEALRDLLDDGREDLDERQWSAFVSISCDVIGHEAAVLLLRDLESDERERAA